MIESRVRKRDGRRVYDVRLRDPNGKEYSRTFLTKREAEAFDVAERANQIKVPGSTPISPGLRSRSSPRTGSALTQENEHDRSEETVAS
jgi:hypothetical protein